MPRPPKPVSSIDPRSNATVLFYNGGPAPRDVPARDLHGGDLARILYVRAHVELAGGRPKAARPEELEELATTLSASGGWAREVGPFDTLPVPVEGDTLTEPNPEVPAQPGKEIT
jgi:hypothetical protein